jgi:uncharacterized membrane protein SpoIIM required for sporulation
VIVDVQRFAQQEQPYWQELDTQLTRLEADMAAELTYDQAQRLHYLYQRASAGLARITHMTLEPGLREYLEPLVARAYAEIHQRRDTPNRFHPVRWFLVSFPQTFRRRRRAFTVSCALFLLGSLFGAVALALDPDSKGVIMPFSHLMGSPTERVDMEEGAEEDRMEGQAGSFSAMLMTHNTRVSILTMATGLTFGIGTVILLFYNGVILGAVGYDYMNAGEGVFLFGWLLPHGAVEIPAILIAGQAGILLGATLIGWGSTQGVRTRLRLVAPDLVSLIFGVAILLIWAGIIEAFLSQYHEPVLPYEIKIIFGLVELVVLFAWLNFAGRLAQRPAP